MNQTKLEALRDKRNNFALKLSAAKYHLKKINEVYKENKELIRKSDINDPKTRPFLYHYYALVYEMSSAFDMTLHFVNSKFDLGFADSAIQWKDKKTKFQKRLEEKSPESYQAIQKTFQSPWFEALKTTRDFLFHNGIIGLQIDCNDTQVNIINPVIGQKVLHFDCNLWEEEISKFFNSFYSDEKLTLKSDSSQP